MAGVERRCAGSRCQCWALVLLWAAMATQLVPPTSAQNLIVRAVERAFRDLPAVKHALFAQPAQRDNSQGVLPRLCYNELGCLDTSKEFFNSMYRSYNLAPNSRASIGTTFRVSSREDPGGVVVPRGDMARVLTTSFKATRPTKIVVHGYLNGTDMPWLTSILDAYRETQDVNLIYVDWTGGSFAFYSQAVANARVAALEVAHLINWLKDKTGLNPADVHIIGHSLGAHVAGYIGERVPGLGRITGLDPAEPFFQFMPPSVRLDPTDATFVDVIHTDADTFSISTGYGLQQAIGHLDFYPNGGQHQPGCSHNPTIPILALLSQAEDERARRVVEGSLGCNHMRAVNLFLDSITSTCPYVAFHCSSYNKYRTGECFHCGQDGRMCAAMGDAAMKTWPGVKQNQAGLQLYLSTAGPPGYCLYHYKLSVEVGAGGCGTGYLNLTFNSPSGRTGHFDLTRRSPRKFEAGVTYPFFLEHRQDLTASDMEAQVTWTQQQNQRQDSGGSSSCNRLRQAALPLARISVINYEMAVHRSRTGRSYEGPSDVVLCPADGGEGVAWVGSGQTVRMSACTTTNTNTNSITNTNDNIQPASLVDLRSVDLPSAQLIPQ